MASYTYMSVEAIDAAAKAGSLNRCVMNLSPQDFARLLWTLYTAYESGIEVTADFPGTGEDLFPGSNAGEWAGRFASDLAGTVGVEMV